MNVWAIGGFATTGFIVFFLTANSNLAAIRGGWLFETVVLVVLVALAIWSFVMAVKSNNK